MPTYNLDGRLSIDALYQKYEYLQTANWDKILIYKAETEFPVYAFISPSYSEDNRGYFWVLAGIHGEEPAGPNAISDTLDLLIDFNKSGIPFVVLPLLNPLGYYKDYRYYNEQRDENLGLSVTDAEFKLPDTLVPTKHRAEMASNLHAQKILNWVEVAVKSYPPLISVDHHEDEIKINDTSSIDSGFTYSYANGEIKLIKPMCALISDSLTANGFPVQKSGKTRFGEEIVNGFVLNKKDGSIDEYLSYAGAKATFVIETTRDNTSNTPLHRRVEIQREVIRLYPQLWNFVDKP